MVPNFKIIKKKEAGWALYPTKSWIVKDCHSHYHDHDSGASNFVSIIYNT